MDKTLTLADGRTLGFAEYGSATGKPVFFFHGWPGSRLFIRPGSAVAAELGVRIIAPDRPGFGLSTHKPERTLIEWTEDVFALAAHLQIDRFAVAGHSGGGPYALACAFRLAERVTRAAFLSGVGPMDSAIDTEGMMGANRLLFALAHWTPTLHRGVVGMMVAGGMDKMLEQMAAPLPEVDRNVLASIPDAKEDLEEAFRSGAAGPAWEHNLLTRPWGFELSDVHKEVLLYQGGLDVMVPLVMGERIAKELPHCRPYFYLDEGHFLLLPRWKEILQHLVE